ncbi:MAG: undecaprenyldiphospho-muramoylpentapeptide beta-N-acetylglucosaminyltransferase [Myxococcales bacterium]|nr:undecaprenyldiphospho-muramoylpentapeptide beta-N-acetylglucosaminyltransferase [Myxococcales bacterium]
MNLLVAGGGTGGHLFPGLAVAQEVRRRRPSAKILFVGTRSGLEAEAVPKAGFEVEFLPVSGLKRVGLVATLKGLLKLPLALLQAFLVVFRFRPDVAISVGGYAAGPAILAAYFCRVPVAVMEQNALPGVTNRILGHLAYKIFAGLPTNSFKAEKLSVVGNPVRTFIDEIKPKEYVQGQALGLLVMGGSQGAVALNNAMIAALPLIKSAGLQLEIVHQTGKRDYERVRAAYESAGVDATICSFIDDMAQIYSRSHFVIGRAGASSVAELALCGLPSLLVPFPYAADNHQEANARILSDNGAAFMVLEQNLSGEKIAETLQDLTQYPEKLKAMAVSALGQAKPNAAASIVDELENEVGNV